MAVMKKSHPLRHRLLAARSARRARTLAARRQVEALAAILGYRRAAEAAVGLGMRAQIHAAMKVALSGIFAPGKIYDGSAIWKRRA
jgi:hypothetical protein